SVDGSRRAENLNNTYFRKGRHTPMAILVKGGTLSQKSYTNLQQNITEIEGEKGQHAFMVLELEGLNSDTGFENTQRPEVEIKDLAPILQKDELFQEYLDNNRRRIQSAFQLPDIYVGYSSDYTRATAQVAMEVTEQQVFQPERASLEWIINNKLLNGYGFKYVHITFKAPEIRNPDDLSKILGITERAGGLTPNKAKEVTYKFLGDEYEDYPDEWGNIPIALAQQSSASPAPADDTLIAKSSDDVISVLKSIRDRFEE
ncbi:phage portal protein, pbsx family, partial [human gut metagenome]